MNSLNIFNAPQWSKIYNHMGIRYVRSIRDSIPNFSRLLKIPLFDDAIELVKKAALVIPEIRQIGWDVCISENGPAIIEGNDWSDYMFWQLPEQTPDKIGLMPYYRKLLPELKI